MVSFTIIKSSCVITSSKCQLQKQWNFVWTRALDNVPSGFGRYPTCFLAKYWSIDIAPGSHKISRDKSHEINNVTDFNVADSVRRDIKVLVTRGEAIMLVKLSIILFSNSQNFTYYAHRFYLLFSKLCLV